MFSKLYIGAVMLQKGTLAHFWKKKYIYFWRDVIYFTYVDFRFTKYIPQKKQPCIDFILDLFLIACINHFF